MESNDALIIVPAMRGALVLAGEAAGEFSQQVKAETTI